MTTARDIMHAGAQCVGENQTLLDAARMMRDQEVGSLPICGEDDRLKGVVTDRDIVVHCLAEGGDPSRVKAKEFASHIHAVSADDDIGTVLRKMQEHKIRRLPVIDNGRLCGMISEADLAVAHARKNALSDKELASFVDQIYATT
ncbi:MULTISPECIES: CBS domain-containing protein [Streptomycetaceae]|uniref:CBS domain-containing protein n=1 Tax=Streptantibioticus cattleyicolor (strain ATCC 35852 / DSM 46488 / JCM 4925 / NBRC 14057 / NRRL 8057) TaxID=1003195 RepID=F8JVY1_STREN|nr:MULTISPECIES: CBS domain-containing protein [Streptomycetaceae]AEW92605.1 CBS domain-containing protein [Streptantibioticus cattleyicolor NRRL 8057 = DSM 46488]MYS57386.1 CBS domain-containing protein [Streptomyces sp. SID5468]CCB72960.1 CBS domain protein [Streptantibioticus cattleyicolor NRRL 8057 = DSM 46488]